MKQILVTRRWPEKIEKELLKLGNVVFNPVDAPLSREDLCQALLTSDVLCSTVTDRIDSEMLASEKVKTRLIANFGVGYENIAVDMANRVGIAVTNTPGVLTDATAEIALTLLLMSARRAGEGERQLRMGEWMGWGPTHMLSTQVTGKKLGIIGMGRIGKAVAQRAHYGLGMEILYAGRTPNPLLAPEICAEMLPLEEVLKQSDFVTLHCPSTPQTYHLIDEAAFELMQPHAHLINTARGNVVNEKALVNAVESGEIAGAGLDVYENEPEVASGLIGLEQVVLLPHMGSGTVETREAMGFCALRNVEAFVTGQSLINPVTG